MSGLGLAGEWRLTTWLIFKIGKEIISNMTGGLSLGRSFQFILTFFYFYILPELLRWIFLSKSSCYIRPTGRLIEIGICWYLIQFIRNKKSWGKKREKLKKCWFIYFDLDHIKNPRDITSYLVRTLLNGSIKIYQLLSFAECWGQLITILLKLLMSFLSI